MQKALENRFVKFVQNLAFAVAAILPTLPAYGAVPDIFVQVGIRPQMVKTYPEKIQGHDESDPQIYLLNVELGTLTSDQFRKLRTYFRNQSPVTYTPGKRYRLDEFLPPVMQALLGMSIGPLDMSSMVFPKNADGEPDHFFAENLMLKSGFSDYVNCVGTAFETSRAIETQRGLGVYHLYSPGRIDASEILSNRRFFETKSASRLRFGDVLHISDPSSADENYPAMVQHMAIFITKDIYFEKRDSTAKDPYRLVLIEDIQKRLKRIFDESPLIYRHGRFTKTGLAQLPPKDARGFLAGTIKEMLSAEERAAAETTLKNLSPQIQNAVWKLTTDEIGLGGGPEYGMSFAERVTIENEGGRTAIKASPETLSRFIRY